MKNAVGWRQTNFPRILVVRHTSVCKSTELLRDERHQNEQVLFNFTGIVTTYVQLPQDADYEVKPTLEIVLRNQEHKQEKLLQSYLRGTA
jgi:hypothetical protein